MQRLLPVFCISGSIHYLRYASWKLPGEYPQIYKHQEGKHLVRTNAGYFISVAHDMELQESKEYLIFRKERYTRMFLVRR